LYVVPGVLLTVYVVVVSGFTPGLVMWYISLLCWFWYLSGQFWRRMLYQLFVSFICLVSMHLQLGSFSAINMHRQDMDIVHGKPSRHVA